MPKRLSSVLDVSAEGLDRLGVFNSFVDVDSKLYFDPSLLEKTTIEELKLSHLKFNEYFASILKLIQHSKSVGDVFWRKAFSLLKFKEFKPIALGYSVGNKNGNAIGDKLAGNLLITASEIIKAGITDPIIFELVGLLEDGIGSDRISDMTIHIIKDDLIKYTQRVCKELNIVQLEFGSSKIKLPYNPENNEPIVFTPKELLKDLPIAFSWEDIDKVCKGNQELREKVNRKIGNNWKYATSRISKHSLKATLLKNPEVLLDLIKVYKRKPKVPYDFINDPSGQIVWAELSEKAANEFPLSFATQFPITSDSILEVVRTICQQFAKLIESNGWFEFLYDNAGKLRNERFAQKLFYGIADQYCLANDLNLSREPNAGSGALDFKITKGYSTLVTVEIKYSSNPNLIKGFTKQLPTYNKAEGANTSIYLVLKTTHVNNSILRLQKLLKAKKQLGERTPEVIVIDATPQKSASLRK